MIDVRKNSILFHAIFTFFLICTPVFAAITDDPCGCDPVLLQRADAGDVNVQSYVAFLYATGKDGVQQNYDKARYWYQRIINHNGADAKIIGHANLRMGILYNSGKGVKLDYLKAMECYKVAAKQGYYEAHLSIGVLYAQGLGVEKDYNQALHWWKIAAHKKQPQAKALIQLLEKEMDTQSLAFKQNSNEKGNS